MPSNRPGNQVFSLFSGKALDVSQASQSDGAQVWQWSSTGADNQRWAAERQADGTYRIVAAHSGKVLDVRDSSRADGAIVHQWTWYGGASQRWRIEDVGDNYARIVNVNSGKVVDIADFSRADGGKLHQWTWHGGANQRWRGLNVGGVTPPPPPQGNVITASHSGKSLDVAQISTFDGAAVHQWSLTGGLNQRWSIERQLDGTYRFVAVHSGKVLDVAEFSTADGGRVHQWTWHGGANQRWRIDNLLDGTARITNVHSGKVLDVKDVSRNDGAASTSGAGTAAPARSGAGWCEVSVAVFVLIEGVVIALLGLLVVGLLRSHAEILRKLHELEAGTGCG